MCVTVNTIKFLCDFKCVAAPEKTHLYAQKHHLLQSWRGCSQNPIRALRGRTFYGTGTHKPCHNPERARIFEICPECSDKYGTLTKRINSHARVIIELLEQAGGNIDTTGPDQKRASVCSNVIEWGVYLDDVVNFDTYEQKHPSHPPNPKMSELQEVLDDIANEMNIEKSKPGGGDRGIISKLFYQRVRAEIEYHRIWVLED
ncbi:hypothetical protein EAF00_009572 [Botryotinia globosa]|nr:hypothetical protein EAF00_009572 [Botryotinia globosa]